MHAQMKEAAHAPRLSEEDRRQILTMPERHGTLTLAALDISDSDRGPAPPGSEG